jgi:citrate synthase
MREKIAGKSADGLRHRVYKVRMKTDPRAEVLYQARSPRR